MAKDELEKSLDNHQKWFKGEGVGTATLGGVILEGPTLSDVNLNNASLSSADSSGVTLSGIVLEGPTLSEVSLNNADLGDMWSDSSKS